MFVALRATSWGAQPTLLPSPTFVVVVWGSWFLGWGWGSHHERVVIRVTTTANYTTRAKRASALACVSKRSLKS